jgi:hypothetical protein
MLQKGQGIPAAAALNKKVLLSKEISYLFALALHQKKLMHETWSGNQGKWRFHRERERERERDASPPKLWSLPGLMYQTVAPLPANL